MSESLCEDKSLSQADAYIRGDVAINEALDKVAKDGDYESLLMYLKRKDGIPHLSYDTKLLRRAVRFTDTWDLESTLQIGVGNLDVGFCSPEETISIDAKALAALQGIQEKAKSNAIEAMEEHLHPKAILAALFSLKDEDVTNAAKDYFRLEDLEKMLAQEKELIAAAALKLTYPPYPEGFEPSLEELYQIGLSWHLDNPEIARWKGVEPIEVAPVYEYDFSDNPAKAADWLLREDFEVIEYLLEVREKDPIEFSRILNRFKDKDGPGISAKVLKEFLDLKAAKPEREEVLLEDLPRIKEKAEAIIKRDEGFSFCVQSWNRSHHGDTPAGEVMFIQRGIQCCANTKGMHVHLRGESAAGKSDASINFTKRLPKRLLIDADLSPRALYYAANKMEPGSTANIDDILWTEALVNMFKRSTTAFQEGAELLTVVDGKPLKLKIPARMAFVMSSVDSQADEQARDRTLAVDIDSSPARIEQIKGYMASQAKASHIQSTDEEIAICKAIINDLVGYQWECIIPFADRIELIGETRAMAMFLDIIRGVCVWHYTRREQLETDYGFVLVATEADFYEAKRIYESVRGHSSEKLSEREIAILQAIASQGIKGLIDGKAVRLLDYGGLQTITGESLTTVKNTVQGRPLGGGQRGYGLLSKVPALKSHDSKESIKLELPGGEKYSESKKLFFSLPDGFTVSESHKVFKELVKLKEK